MSPAFPARILDQLTTQIPFLWYQRDLAVNSPKYDLAMLAMLDERLLGLLDGLIELSPQELAACGNDLSNKTPGGLFALTFYAVRKRQANLVFQAIESAANDAQQFRAFVSAAAWLEAKEADPIVEYLLKEQDPKRLALGIAVSTARRKDPGAQLAPALNANDALLRTQAIQAVTRLGRLDMSEQLSLYLSDPNDDVRFHASAAASVFRLKPAASVLKEITGFGGTLAERAAWFAGLCMEQTESTAWIESLAAMPGTTRCAVRAIAGAGAVHFVPWLIKLMKDSTFSRIAGETFSGLTGFDLEQLHLDKDQPSIPLGYPNSNPGDNNVNIPADADLVEPDAMKIMNLWQNSQSRFPSSCRWFLGKPIEKANLHAALQSGTQRQRTDAAILLLHLQPGSPQFATHDPAPSQKRQLGME